MFPAGHPVHSSSRNRLRYLHESPDVQRRRGGSARRTRIFGCSEGQSKDLMAALCCQLGRRSWGRKCSRRALAASNNLRLQAGRPSSTATIFLWWTCRMVGAGTGQKASRRRITPRITFVSAKATRAWAEQCATCKSTTSCFSTTCCGNCKSADRVGVGEIHSVIPISGERRSSRPLRLASRQALLPGILQSHVDTGLFRRRDADVCDQTVALPKLLRTRREYRGADSVNNLSCQRGRSSPERPKGSPAPRRPCQPQNSTDTAGRAPAYRQPSPARNQTTAPQPAMACGNAVKHTATSETTRWRNPPQRPNLRWTGRCRMTPRAPHALSEKPETFKINSRSRWDNALRCCQSVMFNSGIAPCGGSGVVSMTHV